MIRSRNIQIGNIILFLYWVIQNYERELEFTPQTVNRETDGDLSQSVNQCSNMFHGSLKFWSLIVTMISSGHIVLNNPNSIASSHPIRCCSLCLLSSARASTALMCSWRETDWDFINVWWNCEIQPSLKNQLSFNCCSRDSVERIFNVCVLSCYPITNNSNFPSMNGNIISLPFSEWLPQTVRISID